jgi:hypothetical protein
MAGETRSLLPPLPADRLELVQVNDEAFAVREAERVPVDQAVFVGAFVCRVFANRSPAICDDFQRKAMVRLTEAPPPPQSPLIIDAIAGVDKSTTNGKPSLPRMVTPKSVASAHSLVEEVVLEVSLLLLDGREDRMLRRGVMTSAPHSHIVMSYPQFSPEAAQHGL